MDTEEFARLLANTPPGGMARPSRADAINDLLIVGQNLSTVVRSFPEFDKNFTKSYLEEQLKSNVPASVFYINKSLHEVMEACVSIIQARTMLADLDFEEPSSPWLPQALREAELKKICGINRRLWELAVTALHFRKSRQVDEFEHYLTLNELSQINSRRDDEACFYGKCTQFLSNRSDDLMSTIQRLESLNGCLSTAWYLKRRSNYKTSHGIFETYRQLFLTLDGSLSDAEKAALGFSYTAIYSNNSQSIHFTPTQAMTVGAATSDDVQTGYLMIYLIGSVILNALEALSNMINNKESRTQAADLMMQVESHIGQSVNNLMVKDLNPGDIVSMLWSLAEVKEVLHGKFGYKSYKVDFLCNPPSNPDSSYIAANLRLFATKKSRQDCLAQVFIERGIDPNILNEEQNQNLFKTLCVFLWEKSLAQTKV